MRLISITLVALLLAIQFPLWLGKGGWMKVRDAERQLQAQKKTNNDLEVRNAKLGAEVKDLKEGAGAVEERARYELGMLKEGEVFVQIVEPATRATDLGAPSPSDGRRALPTR